jgi:hypothetical protein
VAIARIFPRADIRPGDRVMTNTLTNLDRRLCEGRKPMNTGLLAGSLAVLVTAGILFVASFAETFVMSSPQQEALAQCAVTASGAERLACYDVLGRQALRQPAKGANAPLLPNTDMPK